MSRGAKIVVIAFGTFVFLALSVMVARALVGAGNERAAVVELVGAQARGDADRMLAELRDCRREPACARVVRERAASLRRPGEVQILKYDPSVQIALTEARGTGRIAWRTTQRRDPVVQCVKVVRESPLAGGGIRLLAISAPIAPTGPC